MMLDNKYRTYNFTGGIHVLVVSVAKVINLKPQECLRKST